LVGHVQGSCARYLLNHDVSDFALRDFPITFQDNFLGTKIEKIRHPCIRPTEWRRKIYP
jgi:hypothetical protein